MPLLSCVEVPPREAHTSTLLILHGLGANGHDFEPIAPVLGLPHVRFVLPNAPHRPVSINGGFVMPAWYDIQVGAFGSAFRNDMAQVAESAAAIEALIEAEIQRGIPSERILLSGFSQGAAMALHVGHRYKKRLAGILSMSGYLLEPPPPDSVNRDTPLFVAHGSFDPMVPRFAGRQAYDTLATEGRPAVWKEYPIGHEVSPAEVRDIAAWLHQRL